MEDVPLKKNFVTIRFYEELNFFLPPSRRKTAFQAKLYTGQTVKDLIESLGIPHTEVDLVLVNGLSVDFSFQPSANDRISVYPVFETFNISGLTRLRAVPLRNPAFVLDVHLGALARYIRLLGFPAVYRRDWDDADLAAYAKKNALILLSRDRGLLKRKNVSHGMFVYHTDPREQVKEVCRRLDLYSSITPFSRCLKCSGELHELEYGLNEFKKVRDRIPEGVLSWCREYKLCNKCGRVYWEGSHMKVLHAIIESVFKDNLGIR